MASIHNSQVNQSQHVGLPIVSGSDVGRSDALQGASASEARLPVEQHVESLDASAAQSLHEAVRGAPALAMNPHRDDKPLGQRFSLKDFVEGAASQQKDKPALQDAFKLLQDQGYVVCHNPGAKKEAQKQYSFLPGAREAIAGSGLPNEGRLSAFVDKQIVVRGNVAESFEQIQHPRAETFKNWFHRFSNTLTLMPGNGDAGRAQKQQLLKFELLRYQNQATYSNEDAARLGRSASPLVLQGYGRGIKTGLWEMHRKIAEGQAEAALQAATGKKGDKLDPCFNAFPSNRPFPFQGKAPTICKDVPADLNAMDNVYIGSLGLQLVKSASKQQKAEDSRTINQYMGGHGLRTSPAECAEHCAAFMVKTMEEGQPEEALKRVTDVFSDGRDPNKPIADGLKAVNLAPNTMLALPDVDPISHSGPSQLKHLQNAYQRCLDLDTEQLPFHVRQNLAVVRHLLGDPAELGRRQMPAAVSATLSDALADASESMLEESGHRLTLRDDPAPRQSVRAERFYQSMQDIHHAARFLAGQDRDGPSLDGALKSLLPGSMQAGAYTMAAPHGLAMLDQIQHALPQAARDNGAFLTGAYYETPELFPGAAELATVDHPDLRAKSVIVMEPHPNNAALEKVVPHDPLALLDHVFADQDREPCTIVMDVTLNHLGEKQIADTLAKAKPHIDSGKLNLVLVQSGTKFFQNGMDLVNIGTAVVLNKADAWESFNANMAASRQTVPEDDQRYIAKMVEHGNSASSQAYLERIRDNTASLRTRLDASIAPGHDQHNAFELCANSDDRTVYIAFRPTDAFVNRHLQRDAGHAVSFDDRLKVNQELYHDQVLPAFGDLATVDRSSFGFNQTNFGECGETVRVTLGIEEPALIAEYSKRLVDLGARLY